MSADVVCGHCGLGPDQADALGVHVQSVCKGAFAAVERLRASLTAAQALADEWRSDGFDMEADRLVAALAGPPPEGDRP